MKGCKWRRLRENEWKEALMIVPVRPAIAALWYTLLVIEGLVFLACLLLLLALLSVKLVDRTARSSSRHSVQSSPCAPKPSLCPPPSLHPVQFLLCALCTEIHTRLHTHAPQFSTITLLLRKLKFILSLF